MKKNYESAAAAARKGDSSKLDLMKEVVRQNLLQVHKSLCAPGMNEGASRAKFKDQHGVLWARPMPRHGIYQGKKLAGDSITLIDRIRAIDDARISRTNKVTRLHESLVTPNFEFLARVAAEFARLCDEGWDDGTSHVEPREMLKLRLRQEDLWAACM